MVACYYSQQQILSTIKREQQKRVLSDSTKSEDSCISHTHVHTSGTKEEEVGMRLLKKKSRSSASASSSSIWRRNSSKNNRQSYETGTGVATSRIIGKTGSMSSSNRNRLVNPHAVVRSSTPSFNNDPNTIDHYVHHGHVVNHTVRLFDRGGYEHDDYYDDDDDNHTRKRHNRSRNNSRRNHRRGTHHQYNHDPHPKQDERIRYHHHLSNKGVIVSTSSNFATNLMASNKTSGMARLFGRKDASSSASNERIGTKKSTVFDDSRDDDDRAYDADRDSPHLRYSTTRGGFSSPSPPHIEPSSSVSMRKSMEEDTKKKTIGNQHNPKSTTTTSRQAATANDELDSMPLLQQTISLNKSNSFNPQRKEQQVTTRSLLHNDSDNDDGDDEGNHPIRHHQFKTANDQGKTSSVTSAPAVLSTSVPSRKQKRQATAKVSREKHELQESKMKQEQGIKMQQPNSRPQVGVQPSSTTSSVSRSSSKSSSSSRRRSTQINNEDDEDNYYNHHHNGGYGRGNSMGIRNRLVQYQQQPGNNNDSSSNGVQLFGRGQQQQQQQQKQQKRRELSSRGESNSVSSAEVKQINGGLLVETSSFLERGMMSTLLGHAKTSISPVQHPIVKSAAASIGSSSSSSSKSSSQLRKQQKLQPYELAHCSSTAAVVAANKNSVSGTSNGDDDDKDDNPNLLLYPTSFFGGNNKGIFGGGAGTGIGGRRASSTKGISDSKGGAGGGVEGANNSKSTSRSRSNKELNKYIPKEIELNGTRNHNGDGDGDDTISFTSSLSSATAGRKELVEQIRQMMIIPLQSRS